MSFANGASRTISKLSESRDSRTEFKVCACVCSCCLSHCCVPFSSCRPCPLSLRLCDMWRAVIWQGHTKAIQALGWNCVGKKLATASAASDVRVWSVDSHREGKEEVLEDHKSSVDGLCWSPTNPDVGLSFCPLRLMIFLSQEYYISARFVCVNANFALLHTIPIPVLTPGASDGVGRQDDSPVGSACEEEFQNRHPRRSNSSPFHLLEHATQAPRQNVSRENVIVLLTTLPGTGFERGLQCRR
jgi:hypothetical protein